MKKTLQILLIVFFINKKVSAQQFLYLDNPRDTNPNWISYKNTIINSLTSIPSYKTGSSQNCEIKKVKLNFYYIQDSSGGGNFSAISDGLGNNYNGLQFAEDLMWYINWSYSINNKLRIAPGNTIPINSKDIQFVLEGVNYIPNNRLNRFRDTVLLNNNSWANFFTFSHSDFLNLAINRPNTLHIFIQGKGKAAVINSNGNTVFVDGGGGVGFSVGEYICTESYARYADFRNGLYPGDQLNWVMDGEGKLFVHEIGHSFGLSHTVLDASGDTCNPCNDGFPDSETPSPQFMLASPINAPYHPGQRNKSIISQFGNTWQSNNLMDYSAEHALSPMQINFIHAFLILAAQKSWLLSESLMNDLNICNLLPNRYSYYGKNILIDNTCSPGPNIKTKEIKNFYFRDKFEINAFLSVERGAKLEVIQGCK